MIEALKNQIWTTRISRINSERRMVNKENICQCINIYYSCVIIIYSIISYKKDDSKLSLLSMVMSICLLVCMLYLNSQKYMATAKEFRENYTKLQRLEFRLNHINENDVDELKKIEDEYCNLMNSADNHINYDYYCTVYGSTGEYRNKRYNRKVIIGYWSGKAWRLVVVIALIILPVFLYLTYGAV
ncbi:hypothetical protein HMPREF1084_03137 [Clostridium butyricum 60E.3]|nr:SLATT domain-containing protein [Clostridium butyricum]ENZ31079.1 hypothetical protein HMPREF1084_03137 [Clostridium butyricum 60E.3]MCQ2018702.1 SLATT domain-containing protein [Clostridium butyricum]MDU3580345.1 SLATT domain-containing protein [Clostridium butyricum]MDU3594028.1 SLATT domain-containing protein [Clostridium butyricum]MDU5101804.1 SLATT domain-containing protein [Clostridium butyricum]